MLSGLTRVRQFSQDDGHCFVTQEQIGDEVERLLKLVQRVYADLRPRLHRQALDPSRRVPRRHRHVGLRRGRSSGRRSNAPGQTIHRSPRRTGRSTDRRSTSTSPTQSARKWQCATIQLDYAMPERFNLKYIGADNAEHRPGRDSPRDLRQLRAFHRAPHRELRRGVSVVAGAGAGRWSCQSPIATSSTHGRSRHGSQAAGLRSEVDERQEKINLKIREAELQKVPFMLVVGDREAAEGKVAVRRHGIDRGAGAPDDRTKTKGRSRSIGSSNWPGRRSQARATRKRLRPSA